MGNEKVINQILDYIPKIDFGSAVGSISVFETTIRYLGGLLSGKEVLGLSTVRWALAHIVAQHMTCSTAR